MKEIYYVKNVSCSACKSIVEDALNVDGIIYKNLNIIDKTLNIEYDEKIITQEKIFNILKKYGYEAKIYNDLRKENNKNLIKLILSIIFCVILLFFGMSHMFINLISNHFLNALIQFILALIIIIINFDYYKLGFIGLIRRKMNMDTLVFLGSGASFLYGIYAIIRILFKDYSINLYFESAGTILTLVRLGKFLEERAKQKTNVSFKNLIELSPKQVLLPDGTYKDIALINKGDLILLKPGMIAPVDGIIKEGYASMDESLITGESIPIEKYIGDKILSGTSNNDGIIVYEATSISRDSTLSKIIKMVENASFSKTKISKLVDKISSYFVPVVIIIALLSFIYWIIVKDFNFALNMMISVFVISCPCALGLATPLAIICATNKALDMQILLKEAKTLEILHKVDCVVLDKTGTITLGEPKLLEIYTNNNKEEVLKIAKSLEQNSLHPYAKAILEYKDYLDFLSIDSFKSINGLGVEGILNNKKYLIGNKRFLLENNIDIDSSILTLSDEISLKGHTPLFLADNNILAIFEMGDTIKDNSIRTIDELKKMNKEVIILTGDNKKSANTINKIVNADEVVAELMPLDKANYIKNLKEAGKTVLMVGDGLNDSLALQTADVSISLSKGVEISIENSDIVLLKDDLIGILNCINLSHKTFNNIKLSLFWAFFYNSICIPFAAGCFYNLFNITLNPTLASFAMGLSSICVVLNALQIRKIKEVK